MRRNLNPAARAKLNEGKKADLDYSDLLIEKAFVGGNGH